MCHRCVNLNKDVRDTLPTCHAHVAELFRALHLWKNERNDYK